MQTFLLFWKIIFLCSVYFRGSRNYCFKLVQMTKKRKFPSSLAYTRQVKTFYRMYVIQIIHSKIYLIIVYIIYYNTTLTKIVTFLFSGNVNGASLCDAIVNLSTPVYHARTSHIATATTYRLPVVSLSIHRTRSRRLLQMHQVWNGDSVYC